VHFFSTGNFFRRSTSMLCSHFLVIWLRWSCRTRKSSTISCSEPVQKHTPRSCPRSQTFWRRDWLLQRAAYLESKTRTSPACTLRGARRRPVCRSHRRSRACAPLSEPLHSSRGRHFGFLANRRRTTLLPLCFQLLGSAQEPQAGQHVASTEDALGLWRCPKCGSPMKVVERLTAVEIQLRPPPRISIAA